VTSPYVPLVGASAGIFGVLIAAAFVAPNATIMLLFPPIPMQLRTFAWVLIAIAVFSVFTAGHNAGGEAAHLGGAAMGAALMSNPRVLNIFDPATWRR
jgi:membrane associated rhomboid family serine protease